MAEEKAVVNKVLKYSFEKGKFLLSIDADKDGDPSVVVMVDLSEAIQEVINRGEKVEGSKVIEFDPSLGGLKASIDTDQDGEPSVELDISFGEMLSEVL